MVDGESELPREECCMHSRLSDLLQRERVHRVAAVLAPDLVRRRSVRGGIGWRLNICGNR